MPPYRPPMERFAEKFVIDENGCWLWMAARHPIGYGRFWDKKPHYPHRWLWEQLIGYVPEGYELDHLCRVRHCVNPDHLEVVTHGENMARGIPAGSKVTHCPQGHPYDETNTYVVHKKNGKTSRNCRACVREATRRYRVRTA